MRQVPVSTTLRLANAIAPHLASNRSVIAKRGAFMSPLAFRLGQSVISCFALSAAWPLDYNVSAAADSMGRRRAEQGLVGVAVGAARQFAHGSQCTSSYTWERQSG